MRVELEKVNNQKTTTNVAKLFWIVVLAVVLYAALDAVAQLLKPNNNPIADAESLLAVGQYGYVMTVNFVNRGLLSLLFIFSFIAILNAVGSSRNQFRGGIALLTIWAVGALLLAGFPATGHTLVVHLIVAVIAFIGGGIGTFEISRKLSQVKQFQGLRGIALPLGALSFALFVIEIVIELLFKHLNLTIGGLTERLFLGSVLLWIAVVSGYLATHVRILTERVENRVKQ
jgi:hypothetical protein